MEKSTLALNAALGSILSWFAHSFQLLMFSMMIYANILEVTEEVFWHETWKFGNVSVYRRVAHAVLLLARLFFIGTQICLECVFPSKTSGNINNSDVDKSLSLLFVKAKFYKIYFGRPQVMSLKAASLKIKVFWECAATCYSNLLKGWCQE